MPRGARSGARQLRPNRSDLTRPDVMTAPNQPYGVAAQQRAAQNVIPMGSPPVGGGGSPAPTGAPTQQPQMNDVLAAAQAHNGPAQGQFTRPTERPNEPLTHGLPMGAGAGPQALTGVGAGARDNTIQQGTLANLLTTMAAQPTATAAVRQLATAAQAGAQ